MKVKYVYVPQARLVKCYLTDTRYEAIDTIDEMSNSMCVIAARGHEYLLPNQFIGIAHCSPDDVWNPEIGRRVAYDKARSKLDRSLFKRLQLYIDNTDKAVDEMAFRINALGRKLANSQEHRTARIDECFPDEKNVVFTPSEP